MIRTRCRSEAATRRPSARRLLVTCCVTIAIMGVGMVGSPANATFAGPDGRVVFGIGESHGQQFREPLFTMNPDGTAVRQLTDPPWGTVDLDPWWSPDGSTVVFERDDPSGTGEIFTVRADGEGLTQLTHLVPSPSCDDSSDPDCIGSNNNPAWTPDGTTIVFSHCCVAANGGYLVGLYSMGADGSHVRRITLNPDLDWGDYAPTVSPDGRWVAFSRVVGATPENGDQSVSALFVVRIDGRGLHQVTPYSLMVDEKDWSPDGSRIVFVSHAGSNNGPFRADLFTVAPDGSDLTQLTSTTPGKTYAFGPSWAPSGQRIMFRYFRSTGGIDIYTVRPDGTDRQQVTHTAASEGPLSWGSAALG
jgi:TolB protein